MTVTANRKPRKPARETHGKCFLKATGNRTLQQALDSGDALLTLHTDTSCTNYTVLRLADKDGRTVGYRLTKLTQFIADRQVYDIDVTQSYGWQCDCPDAVYQNRECKHCRSLRAALPKAGKLSVQPKPRTENTVKTQTIDGNLVRELLSMKCGEVRHVLGHRCERLASAVLIDERPCFSPRQIAEALASPEPCKRPAPTTTAFEDL